MVEQYWYWIKMNMNMNMKAGSVGFIFSTTKEVIITVKIAFIFIT